MFLYLVSLASLCLLSMCPLTAQYLAPEPKSYVAMATPHHIVIDGKTDVAWDVAPWTGDFVDITGTKTPQYRTRMKMLWDSEYLYFLAEMEEPHIWGDIETRDAVIFHNNDFEIFIDPDGDTHDYLELEVNALNTAWDLWITKAYRNRGKVSNGWDIRGLKSAVDIQGTLNDPNDLDDLWTVEMAMPWTALTEAANNKKIPEGEFWRINCSRVNWDFEVINGEYARRRDEDGKLLPEYNWVWSPQGVVNMHEPERWGYVYFSKNSSASFTPGLTEQIKWQMYDAYRNVRLQVDAGKEVLIDPIIVHGHALPVTLIHHLSGWNLTVENPETGDLLIIKEDSEFVLKKRS